MIRYQLRCARQHQFDSWFKDSAAYEALESGGQLVCPICGDSDVRRAIMAPAVWGGRAEPDATDPVTGPEVLPPAAPPAQGAGTVPEEAQVRTWLRALRRHVEANFDNVGDAFAEEARKIYHGEAEERGIYGDATVADAEALWEDGIPILPLPEPPDDA